MTEPTDEQLDELWDEIGGYYNLYPEVRNTIREALNRWGNDENYGLPYTYKVVCDETNNTPEDVENGVVNADIYFSPKIYTPHINTETVLVKRQTYPSWCCQKCGEQIGYIGRFFQFLRVPFYQCEKCQIPS